MVRSPPFSMLRLPLGGIYGLMVKGFEVTHHTVGGRLVCLDPPVRRHGFVNRIAFGWLRWHSNRLRSFSLVACLASSFRCTVSSTAGRPPIHWSFDGFYAIWSTQVRYVGVQTMVVGGIYCTLWSMRKTIITGLSKAFIKNEADGDALPRTDQDIPMDRVFMVCGVLVVYLFFYWWATESLVLALAVRFFLAFVAFFFAAVAGYIAGVVGFLHSPVSGMTIATLLFTVGLVYIVGDVMLGMERQDLMMATLLIAAIVASTPAIAGDVMQDLKTGHMLGATPKRQQVAEIIGVLTGAVVIGPVLSLLPRCLPNLPNSLSDEPVTWRPYPLQGLVCSQAELIGAIVQGAFGGDLNLQMVVLGAAIAVALIRLQMPVMSVAIGIYLPLGLSVPIMTGGIISHVTASKRSPSR